MILPLRVFPPCLSAEIRRFRQLWAKEWAMGILADLRYRRTLAVRSSGGRLGGRRQQIGKGIDRGGKVMQGYVSIATQGQANIA